MRKVKKLEVTITDIEGKSFTSEITSFDENGNTIENIEFEDEGIIQNKVLTKYDDKNRLLEELVYTDGNFLSEHKKHIYNGDGKLDRLEINYQDGSTSVQYMKKNADNNSEEWIEEDEDGELESKEVVHNDQDGRIVKREVFDYRNKLKEAFEFEYDENGDLVERKQFDHRRKLIMITEYEHDENKNLVFRANKNRKGKLSDFVVIDYDENGQVIKQNIGGKYSFVFGKTRRPRRCQGKI